MASREDRVWFVTGASSGFGRAVSKAALEHGDCVVATARDAHALEPLVGRHLGRALALPLDVTDAKAARKAVDQAIARFGRIDVVFNNAGYGHVGAVEELSDTDVRAQLEVNLFGVINVTRAVLPHMRGRRSGHLLQMSSLNGVEGLAGGACYAASKFAIEGFSESLAAEVAPLGIKVTIVEPGPSRTRFLSDRSAKWSKAIADYAESVGKVREALRQMDGRQPGDPDRAAAALLRVVEAGQPPLRLPLGRMALEHVRKALEAELQELDAWAALGATTDFPSDGRPREALVREAYAAFNKHDVEAGVALMDADVDWPDVAAGGFLHGRDQVSRHWREQFAQLDPRIEVARIRERNDGRVEAEVRQVVRRRDGSSLSDDRQVHVFTIAAERIRRMEVQPPASR